MVEAGLSRAQVAPSMNPGKAAEVARSRAQVAPNKRKNNQGLAEEAAVNRCREHQTIA